MLTALPLHTPVHLELASFGDLALLRDAAEALLPLVDSVGLNDQELLALMQTLDAPSALWLSGGRAPTVEGVVAAAEWLMRRPSTRGLSRMHFHSLAFHAVARRRDGAGPWRAPAPAAAQRACASGAATATLSACNISCVPDIADVPPSADTVRMHYPLRSTDWHQPMRLFNTTTAVVAVCPLLACRRPWHTVGLGDAISAAGLLADV